MDITDLFEKRRNPDQNQKVTLMDALEKYRGREVFVSFTSDVGRVSHLKYGEGRNTSGSKLGINPRNAFNTPMGIYTYPIEYVLDYYGNVPFGGDRPYVYVVEPTSEKVFDVSNYSDADYQRDLRKIEKLLDIDDEFIEEAKRTAYRDTVVSIAWNTIMMAASRLSILKNTDSTVAWSSLLRALGYDWVRDDGYGVIHANERHQSLFLHRGAIKVLAMVRNTRDQRERDDFYYENSKAAWQSHKNGLISNEDFMAMLRYYCEYTHVNKMPFRFDTLSPSIQKSLLKAPETFMGWLVDIPFSEKVIRSIVGKNPSYLPKAAIAGKVTDDIWEYVRKNIKRFSDVLYKCAAHVPDVVLAEIVKKEPSMVIHYVNLAVDDGIWRYVGANLEEFAPFLSAIYRVVPDELMAEAITKFYADMPSIKSPSGPLSANALKRVTGGDIKVAA